MHDIQKTSPVRGDNICPSRLTEERLVFRELLQNADDAGATKVQIDFQTSDYAGHSAGADGKANGINGTVPNLNTMEVNSG